MFLYVLPPEVFEEVKYTLPDFVATPFYFLIILIFGYFHQKKMVEEKPIYRYYLAGLAAKLILGFVFLLIFTEYYGYGDTCDYLYGSISVSKLLFKEPSHYFSILFSQTEWNNSWSFFDADTGWPAYFMWKDPNTRFVISFSSIFSTLGMRAFIPTTILVSAFSYLGVWKLFLFFTDFYPHLAKRMAVAVLFLPSVLFWGSGVMKDTYTFASSAWLVYNIYMVFFKKEKIKTNILLGILNVIIIVSVKPYVFIALFPGIIIWAMFKRIKEIKNKVLASLIMPLMIMIGFGITMLVFSSLQSQMGKYGNIDSAVKQAQTIQEDLLRSEQYGSNSYNIGKIDGSFSGMIKIAPLAIIAGMYRPYIWEAKNPVMILSGIENFLMLALTLFLLFRLKVIRFFQFIFSDPVLIFSLLFTIFFMFAVGMATANFGALVRYKIPAMPFFVASAFIMLDKYKVFKEGTTEIEESEE
jgi:hypothetical protein